MPLRRQGAGDSPAGRVLNPRTILFYSSTLLLFYSSTTLYTHPLKSTIIAVFYTLFQSLYYSTLFDGCHLSVFQRGASVFCFFDSTFDVERLTLNVGRSTLLFSLFLTTHNPQLTTFCYFLSISPSSSSDDFSASPFSSEPNFWPAFFSLSRISCGSRA